MTEANVFSKLSRILETHSFADEASIDQFLQNAVSAGDDHSNFSPSSPMTPGKGTQLSFKNSSPSVGLPNRATPFEMWQAKQKTIFVKKDPKVLSESQRDNVVKNLHQTNKKRDVAIMREQNNGLKLELAGHEFKPRSNKVSFELSKSMKPLMERYPGLEQQKEESLKKKREVLNPVFKLLLTLCRLCNSPMPY